ncbi:MAG: transporter [Rikenellaceae bacterium]|nr:transporter [Rikenellaceae bacterium]
MGGYGRTLAILGAILSGVLFYRILMPITFLMPYLIFTLLFIPFCGISPRDMRFGKLHLSLALFQVIVCLAVYFGIRQFDEIVAQGAMICVLAPTATAAVVIGALLGGRVEIIVSYTVLINCIVAVVAPLLFTYIDATGETIPFVELLIRILNRVMPILLLPLISALIIRKISLRTAVAINKLKSYTFYIWLFSVVLTMASTVDYIVQRGWDEWPKYVLLAVVALFIAIAQYLIGWRIGKRFGRRIEGCQLLGQKNTILTIWMAQNFLNPLASIAPAAYVLWQNLINGVELGIAKGGHISAEDDPNHIIPTRK